MNSTSQPQTEKPSLQPPEVDLWMKSVELHEAPMLYTRWAALFGAASVLQQNIWLISAHLPMYPNFLSLFVGPPASRKSTVIRYLREMLLRAGHVDFCPQDMTKSALVRELQGRGSARKRMEAYSSAKGYITDPFAILDTPSASSVTPDDLFDSAEEDVPDYAKCSPITILADELQTQFQRTHDVMSLVQDLYDGKDNYSFRGGHVSNPCVNMLSGVNTETLPVIFDHARLLQGLLSRMILVHAPSSGRKFNPFLATGEMPAIKPMAELYKRVAKMKGAMKLSQGAMALYDKIENLPKQLLTWDVRFDAYAQRRAQHVTKIAMCQAALRESYEISTLDMAYAHTLICYTEANMPDALGEYGFSKMSNAQQAVLNALHEATLTGNGALGSSDLFPRVQHYVGSMEELATVLIHLVNVRAIKKIGDDLNGGGDSRIKYQRVKADLGRWSTQFSVTVFPQLMPEWAMLIGNAA